MQQRAPSFFDHFETFLMSREYVYMGFQVSELPMPVEQNKGLRL